MNKLNIQEMIESKDEEQFVSPKPLMRELPEANEFPLKALGETLGNAAKAIQDKTQAPMAIAAQSVISLASLAAQAYANIVLPNGSVSPLSCYFITVACSGERKSACDKLAMEPIKKFEKKLSNNYEEEINDYHNEYEAWNSSRNKVIRDGKKDKNKIKRELDNLGKAPTPPLKPILTFTEPSFEGLCNLYKNGYPSLGLFASEGGQFVGGYGMSQEKLLQTATALSDLWDGNSIKRVRVSDGCYQLDGRRLSIHLMVQPNVSNIFLGNSTLEGQGLLSRFLVSAPEPTSGTRFWKEPDKKSDAALAQYSKKVLDILEVALPLAKDKSNELAPPNIELSQESKILAVAFYNEVEKNNTDSGELFPIRGLANKLLEHACRLAAVLALIDDIKAIKVNKDYMAAGIELAKYYASEALRVFGFQQVDEDLILAQKLLNWINSNWSEGLISTPDVYQYAPITSIRDSKKAKRIINILEEHGYLYLLPEGGNVRGQKRKEVWKIKRG